jgi:DNA mismatch endonuclease, patch repair protein
MSRIRGKDTTPELQLRRELWTRGVRYRLTSSLPGRPDIVIPKARLAIFVDGCFWHGCPVHYRSPSTRQDFWERKILKNQERDVKVTRLLEDDGWTVLRLWEHEVGENLVGICRRVAGVIRRRSP